MSGNPPSALADFFAAFETASQLMECPAAPVRAEPDAAPVKAEAAKPKRPAAARSKRKHGLGGAGVDLGEVMDDWPPLHKRG